MEGINESLNNNILLDKNKTGQDLCHHHYQQDPSSLPPRLLIVIIIKFLFSHLRQYLSVCDFFFFLDSPPHHDTASTIL